jgi:hypothetical protein
MGKIVKVLITIKTSPLPSSKYDELVCTGGIREDGSFIRLYPIDYRHRPYEQWYKKYQWVQVEIEKHLKDPRPESYRPVGEIIPLGEPVNTKNNWAERKKYVLSKGVSTMCGLNENDQKEVSIGIVKPRVVKEFIIDEDDRVWKPQWISQMNQCNLFKPNKKPLEKIPYKFTYRYLCENSDCRGHKQMIEDWEIGELYRGMRDKFGNEKVACTKVREKYLEQLCSPNIDLHFFVGTILEHGTWIIVGTFWPKKI